MGFHAGSGPYLQHPRRRRLHELLVSEPGLTPGQLASRAGMALGTVRHHLGILARRGIIVRQSLGRAHHFFPTHHEADWITQALCREPTLDAVRAWLIIHPGATQQEALAALAHQGVPRSSAQHRLARLEGAGVIVTFRQGRWKRYWAAPALPAVAA